MTKPALPCSECLNQGCIIKKHASAECLEPFLNEKSTFKCQASRQFILEGAPVNGLFFVYDGCVKVYKQTAVMKQQIIRLSKNGEIVGHRGFATNYVYDVGAIAIEDTQLCHFTTPVLMQMMHALPELMFDFLVFYASQLQKSEANAIRFSQMSIREKVMNGLLFVNYKFGQTNGFLNINLSRKEIADFVATSPEQIIRTISMLKKEGLIIEQGKQIGILNVDEVEKEFATEGYYLEG